MKKFGSSQSVKRLEDARLLTGQGRYIDDIAPKDALVGFVLRSPVAHGTITTLDLDAARAADGVHMVITGADIEAAGYLNAMRYVTVKNGDGSDAAAPRRPVLTTSRVRFVGEAVAFIVADSLAQARDAAELIELDIDDLPVKLDLSAGGAALHDEAPDNVAYNWEHGDEAVVKTAMAQAKHRVSLRIEDNRIIVNSIEPRGCFAEPQGERIHLGVNGQGVWGTKGDLSKFFGIDPSHVRVTTPDVGGGFGMKTMGYPEYFLTAMAARHLGRPVRWMSDRTEAMLADNAGRDLVTVSELGFDENYRLVAYHLDSWSNLGAYVSQYGQLIQSNLFARVLTGTYDIQNVFFRNRAVFTNTAQVDAYRGAGRPEAIFCLERSMDHAARVLGVDPAELRRRNFIRPDQMPYRTATGELYDVGEFGALLDRALEKADLSGFDARRAASAAKGKLRGAGICYYIESILGDPDERAKIELTDAGARVYVGTQSNGQGHETVYPQLVHDQTGLPLEAIEIVQGDSDLIEMGGGTGGSRSVTVQGMALRAAGDSLIGGLRDFMADHLDADDVNFDADEGVFRAPGSNVVVTLLEAAEAARGAGRADLCVVQEYVKLTGRSYPNGCHIAEVEIDPETGVMAVDRYTVVDDFGNMMNPMLAEGQVHGGVAQGIGQAVCERVVYDADGQLLTATFMDYAMPRADNMPFIGFSIRPVPSTANPLGMKGCGEAGTVGALAAVSNAVNDALADMGAKVEMPFTPARLWEAIEATRAIAAE
jgi:carbon-monoxide dehydrogenase large subunit